MNLEDIKTVFTSQQELAKQMNNGSKIWEGVVPYRRYKADVQYTWDYYNKQAIYEYQIVKDFYNQIIDLDSSSYAYTGYTINQNDGSITLINHISKPPYPAYMEYYGQIVEGYVYQTGVREYEFDVEFKLSTKRVFLHYGKGTTHYGTKTSLDINAYPSNGELDNYWYIIQSETTRIKGQFIDIVYAPPETYPDNGAYGDYWYELIV